MMQKESNITYISEADSPYDKIKAGFLDPYYNKLDSNSDELKQYKTALLTNIENNAEAFLRNVLLHLRKMLVDGLLISELDIIAND